MLALITGGNRGIGLAIAKALAEEGIDLVLVGMNEKGLESAKKEIGKKAKVWTVACDVSDDSQVERLASEVGKMGKLDILINNAGVACNRDFESNSDEEIDRMIDVNLRGLIKTTKKLLPTMDKGILINISSGAGKQGFPGLAVYCATKFGVIGFTEALAGELEGRGIRAYTVCPGDTQTDMWDGLFPGTPATYQPEDVAVEVLELIRNSKTIRPGEAIDVRKHV